MIELLKDPVVQFIALVFIRAAVRYIFSETKPVRLVLNIIFFSALTVLLILHGIPPYLREDGPTTVAERVSNGFLKTIWWIGGRWFSPAPFVRF